MLHILEVLTKNSLEACIIAAVILLFKAVAGKRLSPQLHFGIWGVFLLKLALPVRWNIPIWQTGDISLQNIAPIQAASVAEPAAPDIQPVVQQNAIRVPVLLSSVLVLLYTAAVIVQLLIFAGSCLRTRRILRRSEVKICQGMRVCYTEVYPAPFLFGVLRPVAVLPKPYEAAEQTAYIIAHEAAHAKQKDHLISVALYMLRTIYWFNPFIWLFCRAVRRDMETACDARVVKDYSAAQKCSYATALVEAAGKYTPAPAAGFAEKRVRGRVQNILRTASYSKAVRTITVLVTTVLMAGSFIGAGSAAPQLPQAYQNALEQIIAARQTAPEAETLVHVLPMPDPIYRVERISQQTAEDVTVFYVIREDENFQGGYSSSNLKCNAILLLAGTEKVNTVHFAFGETVHTFRRADMEAVYGKLTELSSKELTRICYANRAITADRMHCNRIRWNSEKRYIISRYSEPDDHETAPDGTERIIYRIFYEGKLEETVFWLRNEKVTRIDTEGDNEFAWNLGVSMDMNKKELVAALGSPTEIRRNTWFYRTDTGQYVYFTYRNGKMTRSGLCEQIF
ncbi:MAG: M56 family metallopeptidase [Clostridia bacterium]|nr:M56 family metallopeptidase [Clostridia bacterium]